MLTEEMNMGEMVETLFWAWLSDPSSPLRFASWLWGVL